MDRASHNSAEWLVVCQGPGRGRGHSEGWYVVRVCPCHWGDRVTLPYPTQERAERGRRVILGLEGRQPDRLVWVNRKERPPAVLAGQVWRRNRWRYAGRYFRILDVQRDAARVRSVERVAGDWRWLGRQEYRRVLVRRLLAGESYTWVKEAG